LAYLANLKGWKLVKAFIERIEGDLDVMESKSIESGASYEEIGKITTVKQVVKNVTRRITGYVEDARGTAR